jgi:hypothetical protein
MWHVCALVLFSYRLDGTVSKQHSRWIETAWEWMKSIGLSESLMKRKVHPKDALAHYAKACTDVCFEFPFGEQVHLYTYFFSTSKKIFFVDYFVCFARNSIRS